MITIQNAENAMKNIYLDSVVSDINMRTNPFLTLIQENAKKVAGKEARVTIRYGNEGCVKSGVEGGCLPTQSGKSAEIIVPLKNLYGTFQISDKAIRAVQNDAAGFANLLSGEMANLVGAAKRSLNSMLYGNGRKFYGYTEEINKTGKFVMVDKRFASNFKVGDTVILYSARNNETSTVLSVDSITAPSLPEVNFKIQFVNTGVIYSDDFDRLYIFGNEDDETVFNGVDSIFRDDKMYNLTASTHSEIRPYKQWILTSMPGYTKNSPLNEEELIKFFDRYEEQCQGVPADILLTHPVVRKAVFETLKDTRSNIDTLDLAGGFKGFTFNGIPMYADVKCKGGTLYALNSDSWAMHQLCDWDWITSDDGSVLRQIDGKAGYSATLVKYADLLCDKPFLQGMTTGYSAKNHVTPSA